MGMTSATNLTRNGTADWLLQRVTALILAVYTVVLLGFLLTAGEIDYARWQGFIGSLAMQIGNTLVVFAIAAHAWIGLWTVTTDYLNRRQIGGSALAVRLMVQLLVALVTLACVLWGLVIIWGGA